MDNDEPTTVCTSVVSFDKRDSTSPVCVVSKTLGFVSAHGRTPRCARLL
jgi:hypothetical protein